MLATYPQYSPQALTSSPFGAAFFGQPGVHGANALGSPFFGQEPQFGTGSPFVQSVNPWQTPIAVGQQLVLALGQLAQHISIQSVLNQQIASALYHLTHQLQPHGVAGLTAIGMGQPYGQMMSPFAGSPFLGGTPGGYPGWQTWGGQRPQTIQ